MDEGLDKENADYVARHVQSDQRQESEEPSATDHQPFLARAYRYIHSISKHAPTFGSKFRLESAAADSNWVARKNKKRKTPKKKVRDLKKMW